MPARGNTPAQIRDQIVAVLSTFHTANISLDSEIVQPGYTRTLRQCLNIDQTGKINTMQLLIEYIEKFIDDSLKLNREMKPKQYTLDPSLEKPPQMLYEIFLQHTFHFQSN